MKPKQVGFYLFPQIVLHIEPNTLDMIILTLKPANLPKK